MSAKNVTSVVVAIDTDQYAGNFERQMCAFITGQVGDCEVGKDLAELALEEFSEDGFDNFINCVVWIEDHIVSESDENGCQRPVSIWPTEGRANNGSGGHFNVEDLPKEECWQNVHWPAYESVAIFFDEVPPKEVINFILQRAIEFGKNRPDWKSYRGEKKCLTISRVRVLEPKLVKPRHIEHVEVVRQEV